MAYYRQLVELCMKALSTFDPSGTSIEDPLEQFLKSSECVALEGESDWTFVREVVAGCIRHRPFIKVVVSGYYCSDEGSHSLRTDSQLYYVVCYLLLFRLREMGVAVWRRLINALNTNKMHKFLTFTLGEDNLNGWITAEWYKVYDKQFVDSSILSPLKQLHEELWRHVEKLEQRLSNITQSKPTSKAPTEPVPFKLTRPQTRSVPTPDKIPALKPHKPVPPSTYTTPAEQTKLEQAFKTNRMKAQATVEEAERRQFACANAEKSEKSKAKIEEILRRREAELQYRPVVKAEPAPHSMEGPSVKLNTAAVLREGARVQNELLQQEKRLASLEAGERDAAEFTHWQEEMKQRKAAEQLAEIERRHLQAKLSYEEAIIARESHMRDVHLRARAMKEESESLMQTYFARCEEQQRELRRLVEATISSHHNTREARSQLQAMKRSIVEAVSAESRALMARALEEAEEEMRCKAELIQQIRAMERVPLVRTKLVDLTETGGQGLLAEMSVAELRERLALMRVAEAEEEERRRREIAATKQAKERLLSDTKESISRHRKEQNKQTISRQERGDAVFTKHHNHLKQTTITQLQDKLQARRRERERLQSESQVKQVLASRRRQGGTNSSSPPPPSPITSTLLHC